VTLTGLHPARHLALPEDDPELVSKSTSWWDATPVDVPVTIRRQNRSNSSGRPSRARDTRAARQVLKHRKRRERDQVRAALGALVTNGPVHLSDFGRLDRRDFDLLLELLTDALSAREVDGVRASVVGASGVRIALTVPEPARPRARLQVVDGTFTGPDYLVDIRLAADAGRDARGEEEAG
jgi:uncharacterized protein (TIGR02677 family)